MVVVKRHEDFADALKCGECGKIFVDDQDLAKSYETYEEGDEEKELHFKALKHLREEHDGELFGMLENVRVNFTEQPDSPSEIEVIE